MFLSETFWNNNFTVKFENYSFVKKDRSTRRGGGVAILFKKTLNMSPIPSLVSAVTLEVIGAQLATESGPVDCFSVYCPRGDCPPEDLHVLLNRPNPFIIAGDFNAHHSLWESNSIENTAGKSIYLSILEHPDATILTPKNIGTRINPATGKVSTIDLIIASSYFGLNSTITQGPYSGSDHLPIITTLNSKPVRQSTKPPSWIFDKSKWLLWNSTLGNLLIASSFPELQDPTILYDEFMNAILASSYSTFRKSSQPHLPPPKKWFQRKEIHGGSFPRYRQGLRLSVG
jgi:hypothetical protein